VRRAVHGVVAVVLALAGTGGCGSGRVNENADAPRPVIDPTPYSTACVQSDPAGCPAPYECTIPDLAHDPPSDLCLIPCTSDRDCPDNNFCNGVRMSADIGATYHCANNP